MLKACRALVPVLGLSSLLVTACQNDSQAPRSRPEPPAPEVPSDGLLAPLDLIYVCGNKFLATNATGKPVEVTYRVVGTEEGGSLTLREAGDDESHSETELKTTERGVVELYQDDERVARRRNGTLPCGPSPMAATFAGLSPSEAGSWEAPIPWPVVALQLSLLPNGLVLSWGHNGESQLWDPNTGNFTEVSLPTELFCSGHTQLSDGRLLAAGGHITDGHGLRAISIFSPSSGSWSSVPTAMGRGRWYPSTTLLSTGEVLIMGGRDEAGLVVAEPEVWSSGSVRVLSAASRVFPYYPRAFLAPNGDVFYAGEQQTTRYLDPTSGTWSTVGNRLYGTRDYGAAVMYDVGKILYVGGGHTTNTAEIIDLNDAAPNWQWAASMANPRRHLNATVLPTGEVLVTSGSSGTNFNDVTLAVHAAELWNPNPPPLGTWTVLAGNTINRVYHSTSLLLPDGRVLHTGSGDGNGAPAERNAELYSPPYLFKGPRPTLNAAPASVGYGTPFTVTTPDADDIAKVSLIHLGSTTHAFDLGQRFQWLSFQHQAGELTITVPDNRNVTPPGPYMLFLLSGDGVPSVAKIISVGTSDPAPPSNAAPTAGFSQTCTGLTCTFSDGSADGDGTVTGWSWDFADGSGAITQNPTHTYDNGGSYPVTLVATDDDGATATASKIIVVTAAPPPNTSPTAGFSQTCTGLSCTFTDGSTDSDGTVTGWSWNFGDGGSAITRNPSHSYTSGGTYTVSLVATDDDNATASASKAITVTAPATNIAPTAAFAVSCSALICRFTNQSTDVDGSIMAWKWTFGNGTSATSRNPSRTYASSGTYTVTLRVTDDDGATKQRSRAITITSAVKLTVTGRVDATKQYVTVKWSGARGSTVDLYRNRKFLNHEPNDGLYTASRLLPGLSKYTFSVCELGSTTICSNEASVTF